MAPPALLAHSLTLFSQVLLRNRAGGHDAHTGHDRELLFRRSGEEDEEAEQSGRWAQFVEHQCGAGLEGELGRGGKLEDGRFKVCASGTGNELWREGGEKRCVSGLDFIQCYVIHDFMASSGLVDGCYGQIIEVRRSPTTTSTKRP